MFLRYLFTVVLLSGCSDPPSVQVTRLERIDVESIVSSVNAGTVKAEKSAELAFGAVGRVKLLNVSLGEHVRTGSVLAEIENDDAQKTLSVAERELQRRSALSPREISPSELDAAKQAFEIARMNLEKTLIRAPYDGVITEVNLELGQLSQITAIIPKPPLRIIDTAPRYIRAEIDEVDLPKVKEGQTARVKILAVTRTPFEGVVRKVIPYVSSVREQDRTSEIELELKASGILPAGASADVEVIVDAHRDVLALPSRTVLGRGSERFVYRLKDGRVAKTPVAIGLWNYDKTEIVSGVTEQDQVIIPVALTDLLDGMKVNVSTD